jgi:predicted alpha/beta superfamily hydrolase
LETHSIDSKFVDQTFEIFVQVPPMLTDGSERFPVMYLTDCTGGLMFDEMTGIMQVGGDVPRFITVGIGYPADNAMGGMYLRARDLTPTERDTEEVSMSWPFDVPEVESGKESGGAPEFLEFIRKELIPFIDAGYPTEVGDRGYFGDSLGGLFGLYVLFNQPDTFGRYIIGSPSAWWDDEVIIKHAEKFIASGRPLAARVFMGVGALEEVGAEGAPYRMVTNVYRIEKMLDEAGLKGLELSTYTFPDESHTSVIGMNYTRGIKAVYGKPEIQFLYAHMAKAAAEAAEKTE